MTIAEAIVADFNAEAKHTRKILEAVPEDKFDWKPHEKSMTLGQLASHVAETPSWITSMIPDAFDFGAVNDYKPYVAGGRDELMKTFEKNVADFETLLDGRDDGFMTGTWKMTMGEKVLMSEPRHGVIRSIALHHLVHHRGQLTVYLRLLGVPVPATYGPTADEAPPF